MTVREVYGLAVGVLVGGVPFRSWRGRALAGGASRAGEVPTMLLSGGAVRGCRANQP